MIPRFIDPYRERPPLGRRDVEKDAEAGSKRSPKKWPREILRNCLGIDSEKILRVGYPADLRVGKLPQFSGYPPLHLFCIVNRVSTGCKRDSGAPV
jgi:hypothetical protein